ncbi:hypothetical protein [Thermococcus sp. 21S9]|uniref:hypothetical protein n=1 Tax=Thermococcus sp. 21S9 TaxID=1638223 RepID=UPI0014387BB4|nr:hypothetical protein [Thermococcus sp. 21S9]NJE54664.1 hypothetical protein [Thermococcus sp. 21S9]
MGQVGIRLVDSEFELKSIYDFIELFIPPQGEYGRNKERAQILHDFEVECAKVLLEKLRAKEVICDSDFHEIISTAAFNLDLISSEQLIHLRAIFELNRSKTYMNKLFFKKLYDYTGIPGKTLYYHYSRAVSALFSVYLVSLRFDKNLKCKRFYLSRPSTFQDKLLILARFYAHWYEEGYSNVE